MDLSIVIPCYNEMGNVLRLQTELPPIARELAGRGSIEVVFVDDGSTDGTWRALRDAFGNGELAPASVRLERHPENRGLGAALRTGLGAASGQVVVTTDADGTYRFGEIPDLLACLTPDHDIVTASPYHALGRVDGVPAYRLVLSRGSSAIYRMLVDSRVHTYTSLFRAYRHTVLQTVTFESEGFLAGTELLVKAMLKGYRVAEYPTVLHVRTVGRSKARLVRTTLAHLSFQWRVLLHRVGLRRLVEAAHAH